MTALIKCPVPNCGRTLYAASTSKVCRDHNHAVGYCQCSKCAGVLPKDKPARHGVKTVEVAYPTSNSGVAGTARVTLPRNPWGEP